MTIIPFIFQWRPTALHSAPQCRRSARSCGCPLQLSSASCQHLPLPLSPPPLSPCLFIVLKISTPPNWLAGLIWPTSSSLSFFLCPPSVFFLRRLLINPATSSVSCKGEKDSITEDRKRVKEDGVKSQIRRKGWDASIIQAWGYAVHLIRERHFWIADEKGGKLFPERGNIYLYVEWETEAKTQ